jgi:hypothetical protein
VSGDPQSPWFVFRGNDLLVFQHGETAARVPTGEEWAALGLPAGGEPQAVGTLNGSEAWAVAVADGASTAEPPAGMA